MTIIRATIRSVYKRVVSEHIGHILRDVELTHPSKADFVKDSLQNQRHRDATSKVSRHCDADC
jgi:hypothetical protein